VHLQTHSITQPSARLSICWLLAAYLVPSIAPQPHVMTRMIAICPSTPRCWPPFAAAQNS
jgi:hypothetical protein